MPKCAFLQTDQNVKPKTGFSGRGCCSLRSAPSACPLRGGPAGSFVLSPLDCTLPLFRLHDSLPRRADFLATTHVALEPRQCSWGSYVWHPSSLLPAERFVCLVSCASCVSCVSDVCKTCVKCVWVVLRCVLRGRKDKFCNRKLRKLVKNT